MDEKAIEARGLKTIQPELDQIAAIADKPSLARVLGSQLRADVDALNNTNFYTDRLFGLWVSPDFDNPTRNVALSPAGRPRHARSRELPAQGSEGRRAADEVPRAHRRGPRSSRTSRTPSRTRRAHLRRSSSKIAEAHVSRDRFGGRAQGEQSVEAAASSPTKAPGLDWTAYFKAAGLAAQPMIMVWQPSAVTGISALVGSEPLDVWKDYLTFHAIDRASASAAESVRRRALQVLRHGAFRRAAAARPLEARASTRRTPPSATRSASCTSSKYFPPAAKAAGAGDGEEHRRRVRPPHRQPRLDVAGDEGEGEGEARARSTSASAIPNTGATTPASTIERDDALGNAQRAELFDYQRQPRASSASRSTRREWWLTPQTVNAVNLPLQNALNFPAAILKPPFFDANADPVVNYGAHRHGHRPRDQPQLRRPGQPVRRRRHACRTGGRRRTSRTSRPPPSGWPRSTTRTSRCPACTSTAS